jgi:hypothetical protein
MSTLRQTIEDHANQFATAIVQALRSASLEELLTITGGGDRVSRGAPTRPSGGSPVKVRPSGGSPGKAGRLGRRTAEDITRTLGQIVSVLEKHPEGLRAEQIKEALQLDKREMPKPIAEGLKNGALKKTGQKRATVYTAGSGAAAPKRRAKK